jgi:hypothetical protein
VGTSIDVDRYQSFCSVRRVELVQKRQLANGNEEHKFHYPRANRIGPCTYFCEVNPRTRTVVTVRIDKVEGDCQMLPI